MNSFATQSYTHKHVKYGNKIVTLYVKHKQKTSNDGMFNFVFFTLLALAVTLTILFIVIIYNERENIKNGWHGIGLD